MVASYPVSALLHAVVVVKTGLFCIYKVILYVFGLSYLQLIFTDFNWAIIVPIITIFYSSFHAIKATQIKMILAYSTISQLALALLSAFMFTKQGLIAAIMHMVSHSFTKITIFYSSGIIYSIKNSYNLNQLPGSSTVLPKISLILTIALLSLIGIPPFSGFISKLYILFAASKYDNIFIIFTVILSSILSAIYAIKIITYIYKPVDQEFLVHLKLKRHFILDQEKTA